MDLRRSPHSNKQVYTHKDDARHSLRRWPANAAATKAVRVQEIAGNAAAIKAVRLRRLERLSIRHRKNPALVAALLEQIAKEMGNVYTNKRQTEMTGADGRPIEHSAVPSLASVSDEDLAME
jgi:hypothetical protein